MLTVNFTKLDPDAFQPTYATEGSAGLDFYSLCSIYLPLGVVTLVSTGLAIEIPPGYEGQMRPRSSLGLKGLLMPNSPGTFDSDYRGEVRVELLPTLDNFWIERGNRIAQMVIVPVPRIQLQQVVVLSSTARGAGGYGSTGR